MKESKAIKKFAVGAVVRAGIEGAKYLSKKASERAAKKAAQEKAKDGISDLQKAALTGAVVKGLAVTAFDKDQQRKEAERAKAPARTEFENLRRGGSVSSASKRADGCAVKGKTKGRFV